ncbi:MAG: ComF family protein [Ideonella sp.]|nr:ComF family protein [Ideonella sp.]MCC7456848.1 ComF family protein [Nitrospira sp.]
MPPVVGPARLPVWRSLLPRPSGLCALCRDWGAQPVCEPCLQRFAPLRARCAACALPTAIPLPRCGRCAALASAFTRCIVGADYAPPWRQLIADFKFHRRPEHAAALSRLIERTWRASADDDATPVLLLPVPLAPQRLRERGYNQAWELARRLGRRLRIATDATLLRRGRDTAHQIGMTRSEREHNLRDAFEVDARRQARLQGCHVALVDDVLTTGATAHAAALALRRAGAARVDVWVVARTPLDDE